MARYIDADKLLKEFEVDISKDVMDISDIVFGAVTSIIEKQPEADVVSTKAFEQVKWERDTAIEQLQSYGVGFCENKELVEVKHGNWIEWWDDNYLSYCHKCSECGEYPLTKEETMHDEVLSAYCPHCGAKMDGGGKE